ncbi:N-terminal L-serine N(alpha)-acetyltransferase NAT4 [Aspergillus lucknowensis]|uniref:N-alpha-acetyltransferase 40 n=1 Tax=Aspergillus lucknowensis TaxID=176173 RepID=A0ABR4LI60_9EURO
MPLARRRSKKRARTGTEPSSKRRESDARKPKPLPLVERTNALTLEEFLSLYIPSSELEFQKLRTRSEEEAIASITRDGENPGHDQPNISTETQQDKYTLDIYTAGTIPAADLNACFQLIELTSSTAYKNSKLGWSPAEKKKEMKLPDMKYMILRRGGPGVVVPHGITESERDGSCRGEFAGFLEFMVTYEDGYEVLYCYEIHLMPEAQGRGLGEELMVRFGRIGARIGLEKAMLTVFKSNPRAITFYERVGYTEDENSPRPRKLRNGTLKEADYQIMSKRLP